MFTISMYPAYIGDALWVEYGDPAKPNRVLIDGGLVGTAQLLRERIEAVAEAEGRCKLDLLVISHIDADHIEGIIKLLGDPKLPLDVDDIWFNGAKHLPGSDSEHAEEFLGARQGEYLSAILEARGLPWNDMFDGGPVWVPPIERGDLPRKSLAGGMELILLSPTLEKLVKLADKWDDEIEKAGLDNASLEDVLDALQRDRRLAPEDEFLSDEGPVVVEDLLGLRDKSDHSAANGSSIAFLATYDGASCLFAADAHSPVLAEGIDRVLAEADDDTLALDVFKLPHHGSAANLHSTLLDRVDCHRFLVSTDGKRFHHPDRAAIARVIGGSWRGEDPGSAAEVELVFNYRTEQNEVWDDDELRERWNYRTSFPAGDEPGVEVSL